MLEWIGIGIMIAIGFYVAPFVLTAIFGIIGLIVFWIAEIITSIKNTFTRRKE